jgi:hypothetical protein
MYARTVEEKVAKVSNFRSSNQESFRSWGTFKKIILSKKLSELNFKSVRLSILKDVLITFFLHIYNS